MADQNQNPNVEIKLSVDLSELREGFSEAQRLTQEFQRFDQINTPPATDPFTGIPQSSFSQDVNAFTGATRSVIPETNQPSPTPQTPSGTQTTQTNQPPPTSQTPTGTQTTVQSQNTSQSNQSSNTQSSDPDFDPNDPFSDSTQETSESVGRFIGRSRKLNDPPKNDEGDLLQSRKSGFEPVYRDPNDPLVALGNQISNIGRYTGLSNNVAKIAGQPQNREIGLANLGMLQNEVYRASAGEKDPERVRGYQELINQIKKLTDELKETNKSGGQFNPALSILRVLQGNAIARVGNTAIQDAMSGNPLGSAGGLGGGAIGGVAGLLGGFGGVMPGAGAGSAIGRGLGTAIQGFANFGDNYTDVKERATDLAGRFGDFSGIDQLAGNQLTEFGYSTIEFLQQSDSLRSVGAVDTIDEATDLVPTIQELSRALGVNSQVITDNTASLRHTEGGEVDRQRLMEYMSDVVGAAIESGFESRKGEFKEVYSSLSSQAVSRTYSPIQEEEREGLLGVLTSLFGTGGELGRLLQGNPLIAGELAQQSLDIGVASDRGSIRAAFLRQAEIDEGDILGPYQDVDQRIENAGKLGKVAPDFLAAFAGISTQELRENARQDPEYVRDLIQNDSIVQKNLKALEFNTPQGQALYATIVNREARGESLSFDTLSGDAEFQKLIEESKGTTAAELREQEAELMQELLNLAKEMQPVFMESKEILIKMADNIKNLDFESINEGLKEVIAGVDRALNGENGDGGLIKLGTQGINVIADLGELIKDFRESNFAHNIGLGEDNTEDNPMTSQQKIKWNIKALEDELENVKEGPNIPFFTNRYISSVEKAIEEEKKRLKNLSLDKLTAEEYLQLNPFAEEQIKYADREATQRYIESHTENGDDDQVKKWKRHLEILDEIDTPPQSQLTEEELSQTSGARLPSPETEQSRSGLENKSFDELTLKEYLHLNPSGDRFTKDIDRKKTQHYIEWHTKEGNTDEIKKWERHLEILNGNYTQPQEHNDTPGAVTVTPQTQVMKFAVGDVVEAESSVGRVNRSNATDRKILRALSQEIAISDVTRQTLAKVLQQAEKEVNLSDRQLNELRDGVGAINSVEDEIKKLSGKVEEFQDSFESFSIVDSGEKALNLFYDEQVGNPNVLLNEGSVSLDRLMKAVIGVESTGNPRAINGDHGNHYGLGQVSEDNIPVWTREALGRSLTSQEFLRDEEAQRKTIRYKLNQYLQQAMKLAGGDEELAVRMVASKWYRGRFDKYDSTEDQGGYPTVRDHTNLVLERYKKASPNSSSKKTSPDSSSKTSSEDVQTREVEPLPSLPPDLPPPSPLQSQTRETINNISVNISIPDSVVQAQDVAWIRRAAEEGVTVGIDSRAQDIFQGTYRTS